MFLKKSDNHDSSIRGILDKSPIGATIVNQTSGKILFCNTAFLKMIAAPETAHPENLNYVQTWIDKDLFRSVLKNLRLGKNITNLEVERLCFDNSHCWMLINSQSILFEGQEAQLFWQFDITERKQSEKLVEANELRLKQIFEASPVAIGITRESDSTIRNSYACTKNLVL
jgi:PAS domain-containing protein